MRRIFQYFFSGAAGASATAPSDMLNARFMLGACLFKHLGNDSVKRRILHAHVDDRVTVQNLRQHVGDLGAIDLDVYSRPHTADNLAVLLQAIRRLVTFELELDRLGAAKLLGD